MTLQPPAGNRGPRLHDPPRYGNFSLLVSAARPVIGGQSGNFHDMVAAIPLKPLPKTPEWRNVDLETFRNEIIPRDRPAVLKGLIARWPAVRAAARSPRTLYEYIRARDLGRPMVTFTGSPEIKGNFSYRDDIGALNFRRSHHPFHATMARILDHMDHPDPPSIYAPAALASESFPEFVRENNLDIVDGSVIPRLWIGNAVTAATHYDMLDGVACMVAGRKRFTFFPPDQLPNLYVGPLDLTPGGLPTSLVKLSAPDLARYPRFAQAWDVAETAELEPGDAVFIPNLWWHNVESLEPLNLLVNYWWFDATRGPASPFAALALGLMAIPQLPASRREIWRRMFDHYVFQTEGDPVPYLPRDRRGVLGPLNPKLEKYMREKLIKALTKRVPESLAE
jgi:hypothetical protein